MCLVTMRFYINDSKIKFQNSTYAEKSAVIGLIKANLEFISVI